MHETKSADKISLVEKIKSKKKEISALAGASARPKCTLSTQVSLIRKIHAKRNEAAVVQLISNVRVQILTLSAPRKKKKSEFHQILWHIHHTVFCPKHIFWVSGRVSYLHSTRNWERHTDKSVDVFWPWYCFIIARRQARDLQFNPQMASKQIQVSEKFCKKQNASFVDFFQVLF